jgi:hypothetical protein
VRAFRALPFAAALAAAPWTPALALDYQAHGFAAQGYTRSDGNNVFGNSTDAGGATRYYEAGLSGTVSFRPDLLFSAQGTIRDAGETDTGKPRLDFAFLDARFFEGPERHAGLRIGRVKNPSGLYNETRDVVFTRPGILLPASVYGDNQNQRSILFSADGVQAYGESAWGANELSFTATAARDRRVPDDEARLTVDLGGTPLTLDFVDFWNARLMDEVDGGRFRFSVSTNSLRGIIHTGPGTDIDGDVNAAVWIASAQYNGPDLTLTAEYGWFPNKVYLTQAGSPVYDYKVTGEGAYAQAEYRLDASWSVLARFDATYLDRRDRSGGACTGGVPPDQGGTPLDKHACYAYDTTGGVSWRSRHFGAWAEYHWIDGTATVQALEDNAAPEPHWWLLMLMVGYRF